MEADDTIARLVPPGVDAVGMTWEACDVGVVDSWTAIACPCGRIFRGRSKYVERHYLRHARRCTANRKLQRDWRRRVWPSNVSR